MVSNLRRSETSKRHLSLHKMQDTPYLLAPSYRRNMLSGVLGIKPQIGFNRNLDQLRSQELPPRHLNQC